MKTIGEMFEDAIFEWRDKKGCGTAIIPHPLNDKVMVLGVLQQIYNKDMNKIVHIVVDEWSTRQDIIDFITNQPDKENNAEFKKLLAHEKILVFTQRYVRRTDINIRYNGVRLNANKIVIYYHPHEIYQSDIDFIKSHKFKLVILNKIMTPQDMNFLYPVVPLLHEFKQNEIDEIRTSTPVEDMWYPISITPNSEEDKLLKYYNEYIQTSLNIFGSFDIMQQARIGNTKLNISADVICNNIALENGWRPNLDMSVELNLNLDALYNPNNLRERALMTYDVIRNRSALVSDYKGKLEKILEIVEENPTAKILIVNKRAEFASKITQYINEHSISVICANYHDKIEDIEAVDINGNPLYYKSGPRKGERRTMGSKAQKTLNQKLFNRGDIRVLSTNNAPDKDLSIDVDVIIITSPLCENIDSYLYRLDKVHYPTPPIKLYSLFVKNSLEETKLLHKPIKETHQIVNKCEIDAEIENNSDFIVVD